LGRGAQTGAGASVPREFLAGIAWLLVVGRGVPRSTDMAAMAL